jgi:CheY-like chemotaxis protein
LNILLIDDDPDMCQLTKKVLTLQGHSVAAFANGEEGIATARQSRPNLILMDVMLPGLSGPEIVKDMQTDAQLKNIPVVFLTGLVTNDEKTLQDEGLEVGGIKYPTLGKPYEIERLIEIVKRWAR